VRKGAVKPIEHFYPIQRPAIVLTSRDHEQLLALLGDSSLASEPEVVRFLREELDRAEIVPDSASDMMVSMGCKVTYIDHDEQRVRYGRLVYPNDVIDDTCISVLSPIGGALIGLGPGQSICWDHRGVWHKVTVIEVHEAADRNADSPRKRNVAG
jgi:regulator of nucleoside diphosphate kinase